MSDPSGQIDDNDPRADDPYRSPRAAARGEPRLEEPPVEELPLFEQLVARHHPELLTYLTGLLRDRHAAEEVLQSVYLKMIQHLDSVEHASQRAWLFRVAHNEAIDWRRRQNRETLARRAFEQQPWWRQRTQSTAEMSLLRDEQKRRIQQAISLLPPEQRQVLLGRLEEEKTFAQIAEETGLPLGTVLTRMRIAMERLTRALRDEAET